jgi:hypothetical protein
MKNNLQQLYAIGMNDDDARALRRISLTLRRWYEHECNGAIQRDGERGDGRPFWHSTFDGRKICRSPDRERGALKRMAALMARYPALTPYVQGDPRGCAVYVLRPGDVPEGKDADAYYSRGIPVY